MNAIFCSQSHTRPVLFKSHTRKPGQKTSLTMIHSGFPHCDCAAVWPRLDRPEQGVHIQPYFPSPKDFLNQIWDSAHTCRCHLICIKMCRLGNNIIEQHSLLHLLLITGCSLNYGRITGEHHTACFRSSKAALQLYRLSFWFTQTCSFLTAGSVWKTDQSMLYIVFSFSLVV